MIKKAEIFKILNVILSVLLFIFAVILICSFIALIVIRSLGVGHVIKHTKSEETVFAEICKKAPFFVFALPLAYLYILC